MKFADLSPGTVITHGPASLTEDEITRFAKAWDPQWFHTDPQAARNSRFGGLIGSGWQTCALAMRMACEAVLEGSESYASPGIDHIKWPNPVRPGEPLTWRAEVLEQRLSRSQPSLGILRWRWEMRHADGRLALELEATSLFDLAATLPNGAVA